MEKTKQYFKTICKVSRAFGTAESGELLDLIVNSAVEAMDGKAASLFLADEEKDIFVPAARTGLSDGYMHAEPARAKKEVGEVLGGGHLIISDATTDPRIENHEAKRAEGIISILVVPVEVKGRVIGVLSLYMARKTDFSQDEIDFLAALAEQGGMAIQNNRLIERIRTNSMLFLDIVSSLNSSLDIKKILHILTADMSDALGLKGVSILLLSLDSTNLEFVSSYGLSEEFLNKGPLSADRSIKRTLEGETVVINDARTDSRVQYNEAMKKEGVVSIISAPIRSGDDIVGIMRMYSGYERDFSEDIIILVDALANQGGLAIQNAYMYLALQDDKKSLEEDMVYHRMWF